MDIPGGDHQCMLIGIICLAHPVCIMIIMVRCTDVPNGCIVQCLQPHMRDYFESLLQDLTIHGDQLQDSTIHGDKMNPKAERCNDILNACTVY